MYLFCVCCLIAFPVYIFTFWHDHNIKELEYD